MIAIGKDKVQKGSHAALDVANSQLSEQVQSHTQTMDRLSANLKRIGLNPLEIDSHVTGIKDQYESELRKALGRLEMVAEEAGKAKASPVR